MPLAHAQALLGHSDARLTSNVYTHVAVEERRGGVQGAREACCGNVELHSLLRSRATESLSTHVWRFRSRLVAGLVGAAVGLGSGIVLFGMSMVGAPLALVLVFESLVGVALGFASPVCVLAGCAGLVFLECGAFSGFTLSTIALAVSGLVGCVLRAKWDDHVYWRSQLPPRRLTEQGWATPSTDDAPRR